VTINIRLCASIKYATVTFLQNEYP